MQLNLPIIGLVISALALGIHLYYQTKSGISSIYTKVFVSFILIFTAFLFNSTKTYIPYFNCFNLSLVLGATLCFNFSSVFSQLSYKYEFHIKQYSIAKVCFSLIGLVILCISILTLINNQFNIYTFHNLLVLGIILFACILITITLILIFKKNIQINKFVYSLNLIALLFTTALSVFFILKVKGVYISFLIVSCLLLLILELIDLIKANKKSIPYVLTKETLFFLSQFLICFYIYLF